MRPARGTSNVEPAGRKTRVRMPTDYDKEYGRHQDRFARVVGNIEPGQYGRYKGRLVPRLDAEGFRFKVDQYMDLGRRFSEMVSEGDTIDDALAVELRAAEIELVLEKSLFLPLPGLTG